jgi:hypothetical protein
MDTSGAAMEFFGLVVESVQMNRKNEDHGPLAVKGQSKSIYASEA